MRTEQERRSFALAAAVLVALAVLLNVFTTGRWSRTAQYEPVKITTVQGDREDVSLLCLTNEHEVPGNSGDVICVASMNSDVYHDPGCSYVKRILERNREYFSEADMERAGKRPCKVCMAD